MTRPTAIRALKALVYAGIYGGLLMPLFFWPIVIFPFVFSKLIFFQVLIGVTFPAYVVLAWIEPRYRPRVSLLYIAIAAYFVALGASVVFSVDPVRSWWGNQERMNGLFTVFHFFLWLTMTVGVLKTWPQWRRFLNYEVGLSVFMAAVALLQKPFPKLLVFPAGDRVGGLLDNPIYMGAYQIFNLFFISLLWMKDSSKRAKIWYAVATAINVSAFIAAQSRGAMLGLAAGLLVFAVCYGVMTTNKKAKLWLLAGVLLAFVGYGALFAARDTTIVQQSPLARFTNFSGASRTRLIAWEIAWKGFVDRPITGWGYDTFHILFNEKYNPESLRYGYYETWFDRSHNTIMDVLSMTGILGLLTFIGVFLALFVSVIRAKRRGWIDVPFTSVLLALPVAYFVQNLFVFDHPAAFSMSYLLFALVIACSSPQFLSPAGDPAPNTATQPRSVPWVPLLLLELVFIAIVWRTSLLPFRASMLSIQSNNAYGQGRTEEAFKLAQRAFATPTPYLDEQTFLQSRNFISFAGGDVTKHPFWKEWHDLILAISEKHLARHPRNVHPHFIYARFLEAMMSRVPEDKELADREYRKAIALSPKRQQLYYSYGRFLINTGRREDATEILTNAVSFDEQIGESHWILGLHLMFDRQDLQKGADEVLISQQGPYRYVLQDAREALGLSLAYEVKGDKESLKKIMDLLPTLPQGPTDIYLEIAKIMERQGLIEERDRILNALSRIDKNLAGRLIPLSTGTAKTIAESYAMTEGTQGIITTTPAPEEPSPTNGAGPRR